MAIKKPLNVDLNSIPAFAKKLARELRGGDILALQGPLGSGKTTFVKALGKELKINHRITSPTFVLMNRFSAHLPARGGKKVWLYHLDLYRTKNFKEAKALGLTEIWGLENTITVIEWADKILRHLPKKSKIVKFKPL